MEKYNVEPQENIDSHEAFRMEDAYMRAKKRVDAIVGFYWHFAVYLIINTILIFIIAANSNWNFKGFGTYATAFFWGIGLLFHFLGVFGPNFLFGKDWEKRKIEKFMEQEKEKWR